VGQLITDTFTVTNTGNVTLSSVQVTDTQSAPAGPLTTGPACTALAGPVALCSGNAITLLPGQVATFVGTYAVTQADLDAGSIHDAAVATGLPPSSDTPVSSSSGTTGAGGPGASVTTPVTQSTGLTLAKSASVASVTEAGEGITYTFVVTNTSNVTLHSVAVTDTQAAPAGALAAAPSCQSLSGPTATCSGTTTTLTPGQSATFRADYTASAADIAHGSIADSAVAAGDPPGSTQAVDSNTATLVLPVHVPSSAQPLATTGAELARMVGAALLLIGAGSALVVLAARRRRRALPGHEDVTP